MRGDVHHVLMTADAVGGVWTYALDLARELAAYRIRVTLATMGPLPTPGQLARADLIPGLVVVTSQFQLEWMPSPWDDVAAAGAWLLDLERQLAPDLIHLNGYVHAALPFRAPTLVVGHSCVSSWAEAIPEVIEQSALTTYQTHVRNGVRAADHVAAPSAAMLTALQRHYGPLSRVSVIHNGRCGQAFTTATKEPFVFTAGRLWDRAKNVEAIAAVAADLPWPVFVAGDPGASLPQHVHALGPLTETEIAHWLARAAIFALPARYEPFGLLPLEAALSGCALVLGDIPSLREVWGDAADYVQADDRASLRDTLTRLMEPSRLATRAAAARERAAHYPASRMGEAYRSLYPTIVGQHGEKGSGLLCAS